MPNNSLFESWITPDSLKHHAAHKAEIPLQWLEYEIIDEGRRVVFPSPEPLTYYPSDLESISDGDAVLLSALEQARFEILREIAERYPQRRMTGRERS